MRLGTGNRQQNVYEQAERNSLEGMGSGLGRAQRSLTSDRREAARVKGMAAVVATVRPGPSLKEVGIRTMS